MNDTVIIAGRGPSLAHVDWSELPDAPVVAINGAVELVPRCNYLAMVDQPYNVWNNGKYPKAVLDAFANDRIIKVFPGNRKHQCFMPNNAQSVQFISRVTCSGDDRAMVSRGRHPLDGQLPLLWSRNQSTLFAVQCMAHFGFRTMIFVGNDLQFEGDVPYADGVTQRRDKVIAAKHGIKAVYETLEAWQQDATLYGLKFYCYGPSRLTDFMDSYEWQTAITKTS